MMTLSADVDVRGPLFNGALGRQVARGCEDARNEVGDYAADEVRSRFDVVLRHPTGYLRSQVQVHHDGDLVRVNNGNVIYRFWIEGTGSRNRTTRFKGYRTFRLVAQRVRAEAVRITRRAVGRAIGSVN